MPQPGWAEQDADAVWWRDLCQIARALMQKADCDPARIAGVACSAIAPTMLPLDEHFRPLRPAILYGIDTRASQEIADLNADLGEAAIFQRAGQTLSAQSVGPKALWYRRHQPRLFARTRKIVTAATYLVFRLTGRFLLDNYVAPYFTPFFDVKRLDWHRDWVERVMPLDWLADTAWSIEAAGVVTAQAAAESGLRAGTPGRCRHGGRPGGSGGGWRSLRRRHDGHVWHDALPDPDDGALHSASRFVGISAFAAGRGDSGGGLVDGGARCWTGSASSWLATNGRWRALAARLPLRCWRQARQQSRPARRGWSRCLISVASARPSTTRGRRASSLGWGCRIGARIYIAAAWRASPLGCGTISRRWRRLARSRGV